MYKCIGFIRICRGNIRLHEGNKHFCMCAGHACLAPTYEREQVPHTRAYHTHAPVPHTNVFYTRTTPSQANLGAEVIWYDVARQISADYDNCTRASRFSKRMRLHGPDLHSAQHTRPVHWMAEAVVYQRGFWEGFRQHPQRKSMA